MSQTYQFYSQRAEEAAADAAVATLDNVRERALRSEKTWRGLAEQAHKVELDRVKAEAIRATRREAERLAAESQPGAPVSPPLTPSSAPE
jgi:hypothetical protein